MVHFIEVLELFFLSLKALNDDLVVYGGLLHHFIISLLFFALKPLFAIIDFFNFYFQDTLIFLSPSGTLEGIP